MMQTWRLLLGAAVMLAHPALAIVAPPPWAFAVDSSTTKFTAPVNAAPIHVAGSNRSFTSSQLANLFAVPDWHPKDHPKMPAVVEHGRAPAVYACGYCHLPNGAGRPENANLAGLPHDYILEQIAAFKSGARRAAVRDRAPATFMTHIAQSATHEEIETAAQYFSHLPPQSRVTVIETDTVAHTHVAHWSLTEDKALPKELIGQRIIEVPQNQPQFEHRDSRAQYFAYVPSGSVKTGETLTQGGNSHAPVACPSCHGSDLNGAGAIPRIAGRSPSYVVRQLVEFQGGFRKQPAAAPMTEVAKRLSLGDMIAIASYLATLH